MKTIYGVYGSGGFGREVMPLVIDQYANEDVDFCFIDDFTESKIANGITILTFDEFKNLSEEKSVIVAVSDSYLREKLENKVKCANISIFSVTGSFTKILHNVSVDEGAILCSFVHFTSNIKIGKSFHANIYSYVAHDCVIGDYVTFAPGVKCNGNIHIEDHAYIGTGAVIKQGTPDQPLVIGKGAVVGMGAVVTKSVPAGVTVVGNPARQLEFKKLKIVNSNT